MCYSQPLDFCKLPKDSGPCRASLLRFRYDPEQQKCTEFTYGGCLGNLNNFESKGLCKVVCEGGSYHEIFPDDD
ncbi:unnamed protein product [Dicrocoelium dendriticum]|nr:unnamed protein product [Dicrocoelium dendriticum]